MTGSVFGGHVKVSSFFDLIQFNAASEFQVGWYYYHQYYAAFYGVKATDAWLDGNTEEFYDWIALAGTRRSAA